MRQQNGKIKAFVSSSGGKESALACYKAAKDMGMEIGYILNMVSEDGTHSCSHGLNARFLRLQAEAMDIPIMQVKTTPKTYRTEFIKSVMDLRKKGVSAGVFGDIDVQAHRDWVEGVCRESSVRSVLPLWGGERNRLIEEFIGAGFETIIIAVKSDVLGPEWLGRKVDRELVNDIKRLGNVDICGEAGEYHTFVYNGPIFKRKIELTPGEKIHNGTHWFLKLEAKIGGSCAKG